MNDVVIIDAGGANLGSVRAAFMRLGVEPEVSRDPARIATASKLVSLPVLGCEDMGSVEAPAPLPEFVSES